MAYVGWSIVRVCQFQNLITFGLVCFYGSRYVWLAYLAMQLLSRVIKWRGWESSFVPVDPGILAMIAACYGGPSSTLAGNTPLMELFHFTWGFFVPASMEYEAVEVSSGIVTGNAILALCPVLFSATFLRPVAAGRTTKNVLFERFIFQSIYSILSAFFKTSSLRNNMINMPSSPLQLNPSQDSKRTKSKAAALARYGQRSFNDIKNQIMISILFRKLPKSTDQCGGSLHALYENSPHYRNMPLFSHRAADCFVLCYSSVNKVKLQVRLSLLDCLDTRLRDPDLAIPTCTTCHETRYATLNNDKCQTFEQTNPKAKCIHRSAYGNNWIL
ncbi:hypothetical protein LEN26_017996 [Aphanomyces euteiches]|nr:hypothetical protein LEN26_017996 [Aphanomyces euteiches]